LHIIIRSTFFINLSHCSVANRESPIEGKDASAPETLIKAANTTIDKEHESAKAERDAKLGKLNVS
jgi:hypothetical protein